MFCTCSSFIVSMTPIFPILLILILPTGHRQRAGSSALRPLPSLCVNLDRVNLPGIIYYLIIWLDLNMIRNIFNKVHVSLNPFVWIESFVWSKWRIILEAAVRCDSEMMYRIDWNGANQYDKISRTVIWNCDLTDCKLFNKVLFSDFSWAPSTSKDSKS